MRVLVARPQPGAARTAARLRELGHEPFLLPLSETRPLAMDMETVPRGAAAVAVTSANALRHAPAALLARLAGLPCHAVGERTAAAARAAGFRHVEAGPGGAAALAERIAPRLAGKSIVYLCGRRRFPAFEERLSAAGAAVTAVEVYDTVMVEPAPGAVGGLLGGRPADALLLHSAAAAGAAARLAGGDGRDLLGAAAVLCLSPRIAAAFAAAAPGHGGPVRAAPRPEEEALLALLGGSG